VAAVCTMSTSPRTCGCGVVKTPEVPSGVSPPDLSCEDACVEGEVEPADAQPTTLIESECSILGLPAVPLN